MRHLRKYENFIIENVRFYDKDGKWFSSSRSISDFEDHKKRFGDDISFSIDGIEKVFTSIDEYKDYMSDSNKSPISSRVGYSDDEINDAKDRVRIKRKMNESTDFALDKIKKEFSEDRVCQMFDEEILEWVDNNWEDDYESEYDWYIDHNNGEAQDVIIDQIVSWYRKNYGDDPDDSDLMDIIKAEYSCLYY